MLIISAKKKKKAAEYLPSVHQLADLVQRWSVRSVKGPSVEDSAGQGALEGQRREEVKNNQLIISAVKQEEEERTSTSAGFKLNSD